MKKLTFILVLAFAFLQWGHAQKIKEKSSLLKIDEYKKGKFKLEDGDVFFNKTELSFVIDDWWYVVSYEPLVEHYGRVNWRNAFLYKKKLGSDMDWVKASRHVLFEHSSTSDHYLTYDPYSMNSDQKGTSAVEIVHVNGEDVVLLFVGLRTMTYNIYRRFTRLYLLKPCGINSDGSICFECYSENLTKDRVFPMARISGNVFYDTQGGKLEIFSNDKEFGFEYIKSDGTGSSFTAYLQ